MNIESLIRDETSNALLNVNTTELDTYRLRKNKMQKIDVLEHDINNLRKELQEIKQLLHVIITK